MNIRKAEEMAKRPKISNKQRDEAINHILRRLQNAETVLQSTMEIVEKFIVYKEGSFEEFQNYLEIKHKEEVDEQQKIQESNGQDAQESDGDEGRRTERVCEEG